MDEFPWKMIGRECKENNFSFVLRENERIIPVWISPPFQREFSFNFIRFSVNATVEQQSPFSFQLLQLIFIKNSLNFRWEGNEKEQNIFIKLNFSVEFHCGGFLRIKEFSGPEKWLNKHFYIWGCSTWGILIFDKWISNILG